MKKTMPKRFIFWSITGAVLVFSSWAGWVVVPPVPVHLQPLVNSLCVLALVWVVGTLTFAAGVEAGVRRIENTILDYLRREVVAPVLPVEAATVEAEGAGEDKPHRRYYGG